MSLCATFYLKIDVCQGKNAIFLINAVCCVTLVIQILLIVLWFEFWIMSADFYLLYYKKYWWHEGD